MRRTGCVPRTSRGASRDRCVGGALDGGVRAVDLRHSAAEQREFH